MCTIAPDTGNALVHLGEPGFSSTDDQSPLNVTWYNNYTVTNGTSTLVDGAKRDRLVWAGGTLQMQKITGWFTNKCIQICP